jgi:fructose-bisphosphate aldolase class II
MKAILDRANDGNFAVAAPNVSSELDARAAIEAAEELNAPLILDVGFRATPDIVFFGSYLTRLADMSFLPIAINLDHGATFQHVMMALRAGFTSVMVDRSQAPYEQNVAEVKEIVKIAHEMGVSVEAELGHVGQGSNYAADRAAALTDPKRAKIFIEETGIDCLAVSIGTAHGAYKGTPHLEFDLLAEIKEVTKFPLVLHGGSGTGEENLRKACRMGINKVNVANDLYRGACDTVTAADLSGNGAYKLMALVREGYKQALKRCIDIYGSEDKAWVPQAPGLTRAGDLSAEEA